LYLVASSGSDDFGLIAIDLETGQERWFVADLSPGSGEASVRRPIVSDGVVYVGDGTSTFFAIAADTGAVLWKKDSAASSSVGFTSRTSAFAIDDKNVYVTTADGTLHAIDKATGDDLWTSRYATKEPSSFLESGVVARGGAVYVSSSTWSYDASTPEAERVYSGFGGTAQAFDASSGAKLWESRIGTSLGDPAIVNDVLVVDAGSMFESVRLADGQVLAGIKYTTKLQTLGEIRVAGNVAYVTGLVDDDFLIFKINGAEIIQLWRMPGAVGQLDYVDFGMFAWRNGLLIVTTTGDLYSIAPETDAATPQPTPSPTGTPATNVILPIATETLVPTLPDQQEAIQPTATRISGGDNLREPTVTPADEVTSEASPAATPVTAEEITTPDVAEGKNLDSGWGGAGRTWNANFDALAPAVELLPQGFLPRDTGPGRVYQSQVFGDLLVRYIVRSSPESSGIEAIEWETGEVRWYRETEVRSGFASDGERVFIIETKEPQLGLIALDVESGAEVWNLSIGFNFDIGESAASQSPIVSDGVVYFTDLNSKVGAADAATGELIWSSDSVVSLSDAASSTVDPDSYKPYPAANFALDDRYVYVVRVNRIVETLERVTGEHVRSFELTLQSPDPTDNGEDRTFRTADVDIVATDSAIIVIESLAGEKDSGQIGESTIWALDPESGTVHWSTSDAAVTGNVTIFESVLYVSFLSGTISGFDIDSGGKVKTLDVQMGANDKVAMSSTNDHLLVYVHNEDGYTLFQYGSDHDGQADAVYSLGYADNTPIDYLPIPQYSGDELIVAAHYGTIWRLTPPWFMPIVT
jgi:outer membrane protein assembly factor BamB